MISFCCAVGPECRYMVPHDFSGPHRIFANTGSVPICPNYRPSTLGSGKSNKKAVVTRVA
jgi:hypothetical protein